MQENSSQVYTLRPTPSAMCSHAQIRLSFANLPQVSHRTYGALAPPSTPVHESPDASTCSPHANETGHNKGAPILSHLASRINLSLINRGSVARDHLASERTFLAYVRTSLGIASSGVGTPCYAYLTSMRTNANGSGVALMQFFNVGAKTKAISQPLGATIIFMAIVVLSLGQLDLGTRLIVCSPLLIIYRHPTIFCGSDSPTARPIPHFKIRNSDYGFYDRVCDNSDLWHVTRRSNSGILSSHYLFYEILT